MGDLIKIVGVQYAVNSNHVKGEDMTAQEQQKTIEFLTMLRSFCCALCESEGRLCT